MALCMLFLAAAFLSLLKIVVLRTIIKNMAEILNTDRVFRIAVKSSHLLSSLCWSCFRLLFQLLPTCHSWPEEMRTSPRPCTLSDPGKSWAVYGTLERDGVHYYSFDLEEGERIYLSLFKSSDAKERDFLPALALLGPGLKTDGLLPEQLALPAQAST